VRELSDSARQVCSRLLGEIPSVPDKGSLRITKEIIEGIIRNGRGSPGDCHIRAQEIKAGLFIHHTAMNLAKLIG
jgi:hypothetical protein